MNVVVEPESFMCSELLKLLIKLCTVVYKCMYGFETV